MPIAFIGFRLTALALTPCRKIISRLQQPKNHRPKNTSRMKWHRYHEEVIRTGVQMAMGEIPFILRAKGFI